MKGGNHADQDFVCGLDMSERHRQEESQPKQVARSKLKGMICTNMKKYIYI